jgi:hypothetical protein
MALEAVENGLPAALLHLNGIVSLRLEHHTHKNGFVWLRDKLDFRCATAKLIGDEFVMETSCYK